MILIGYKTYSVLFCNYHLCNILHYRRKPISNKAMKLGGKSKDVEGFVDQLLQEGEHVASFETSKKQPGVTSTVAAQPQIKTER